MNRAKSDVKEPLYPAFEPYRTGYLSVPNVHRIHYWHPHKAWPQADLRIVCDAGHASFEHGIARELVRATDGLAVR